MIFNHVMLDLETLGTRPGSAVFAIGAVAFDPTAPGDGLGPGFRVIINRDSLREFGLTEDPETVKWWSEQSADAQLQLEAAHSPRSSVSVLQALAAFASFYAALGGENKPAWLWGNGADFDNVLLAEVYRALRHKQPWSHRHNRCFRTLMKLMPSEELRRKSPLPHDAYWDAWAQAETAVRALRRCGEYFCATPASPGTGAFKDGVHLVAPDAA